MSPLQLPCPKRFNVSDDLQEYIDHPFGIGAVGYAASVNYCLTTALAADGEGTGTSIRHAGAGDSSRRRPAWCGPAPDRAIA